MSARYRKGTIRWFLVYFLLSLWVADLLLTAGAQASGFYIDGGIAVLDARAHRNIETPVLVTVSCGVDCSYTMTGTAILESVHYYDINRTRNPYGVIAIGVDYDWRAFRVDLQLQHQSSLATGQDRGQNSLRFSVRWYPFGGSSR